MKIKGTAVKTTPEYVKFKFPSRYDEWLKNLPQESQHIFNEAIFATDWYPLHESVIIPTKKIAEMFFSGNEQKAALDVGKYSADVALKGIYKIFLKISTPQFMLSRATRVFSSYYNPSDIQIVETDSNNAVLQIAKFDIKDRLIVHRIAGWIDGALNIMKYKNVQITVSQNYKNNELIAKLDIRWK